MLIHENSLKSNHEMEKRQAAILEIYKIMPTCLTDRDVMFHMGMFDMNAVRPRISEMLDRGILEERGKVTCPVTGRTVRLVGLPESQKRMKFRGELMTEAEERELQESYPMDETKVRAVLNGLYMAGRDPKNIKHHAVNYAFGRLLALLPPERPVYELEEPAKGTGKVPDVLNIDLKGG